MDAETTVEELKQKAIAFRDARNWEQFHTPKDLSMGLAAESGELLECFLWKSPEEIQAYVQSKKGRQRLSEELADIQVFLLYLSTACGIDLSTAVHEKMKLNEKKYPVEKSYNSHKKYTELE